MHRFILIVFLLFFLSLPVTAVAGEVTLIPSLKLTGEYNDNINFTRKNKIGDYLGVIGPAIDFGYDTELLKLKSRVAVNVLRYAEETELNTEHQWYELDGTYKVLEKLQLKANLSYIKDDTIESETEATGLVTVRSERERYNGGCGFTYYVTELSDIGLGYNHIKTEYDWPGHVDYDYDSVVLSYNRRLKNLLDVFTIQPYYTHYDSKVSIVDNYGLSLGWLHVLSETLTLTAFLGARYTETEYFLVESELIFDPTLSPPYRITYREVKKRNRDWGGVADIYLRKTGETFAMTIGYNHDLSYSSSGEPIEVYKIYCNAHKNIVTRFRVGFSANAYMTESEGRFSKEDSRHFNVTPAINYNIAEDYWLQIAYAYSYHYDKTLSDDKDYDRNRVWITLNFRFPQKF